MKMNKEKFLKTEFGSSLVECVIAWDYWIGKRSIGSVCDENQRKIREAANVCQGQWEVYQKAIRQFYGIEYHFSRTDEYFGIVTEDETDWLIKIKRSKK